MDAEFTVSGLGGGVAGVPLRPRQRAVLQEAIGLLQAVVDADADHFLTNHSSKIR